MAGRKKGDKALVVAAAQADGAGIGRIRMQTDSGCLIRSLHPFDIRLDIAWYYRSHRCLAGLRRD